MTPIPIPIPRPILIPRPRFFYALSLSTNERFFVVNIDRQRQVCGYFEFAERSGGQSLEVQVQVSEVFKAAIKVDSPAIIYTRHTLDVSVTPGVQDMKLAQELIREGKVLGIEIDDYIISNKERMYCMRELQPKIWRKWSRSKL